MAKTETVSPQSADELDNLLGSNGIDGTGDPLDELDAALDNLEATRAPSVDETIDLGLLDLSQVVEKDFRPLTHDNEYNYEIVAAKGAKSSAGNLQIVLTLKVIDTDEVDSEGRSLNGVTLDDYPGVDPKQPQMHWKIKLYGKHTGHLLPNGTLDIKKPAELVGGRGRFVAQIDREYNPAEPRNKVGRLLPYKPPTE